MYTGFYNSVGSKYFREVFEVVYLSKNLVLDLQYCRSFFLTFHEGHRNKESDPRKCIEKKVKNIVF